VITNSFQEALDELETLINSQLESVCIVAGDLNVDFSRNTSHTRALSHVMERHGLVTAWQVNNLVPQSTFYNTNTGSVSCIDHFLVPHSHTSLINTLDVCDTVSGTIGHCPLSLTMQLPVSPDVSAPQPSGVAVREIDWHKVKSNHIYAYQHSLDIWLDTLSISDSLRCSDINCSDATHKEGIDSLCSELVEAMMRAGDSAFPTKNPHKSCIPYWKEEVKPLMDKARFWFRMWKENDRPQHGAVYDVMRHTKRVYHYALRRVRRRLSVCLSKNTASGSA